MAALASNVSYDLRKLQILMSEEVLSTVQTYFELKIVQVEAGTLFLFLRDRLHELFHYLVKQTPCCGTSPPCSSILNQATLTKYQFNLLYLTDPLVQPIHENKNKGRILMHCICPLSPNPATEVETLDFTLINCLVKTCRQTPAGHPQWLKDILDVRNHLSHIGDASTVVEQQIEDWWKKIETASLNIAGTIGRTFQIGVKRRIDKMKDDQFHLEEMLKALKLREDNFEKKIITALQNIGIKVGGVPFNITAAEFVKEEPTISLAAPVSMSHKDSKKCIVVWRFSNPGEWDVQKMQEKLEFMKKLGDFEIEFVYTGSIIIHTLADTYVLSNADIFKDAVEEFLFLFTKKLKIPVPKEGSVPLALSIWPADKQDEQQGVSSRLKTSIAEPQTSFLILSPEEESVSTTHAQVPIKLPYLPTKLQLIKQINISETFFTILEWYTDCTSFGETFVVSDANKKQLIICDTNSDNVRHIRMSDSPWRVTAIDETTVAVGTVNNEIQIIDMINSRTVRTFNVERNTGGLAYSDGYLYVGNNRQEIHVFDRQGQASTCIKTFSKPNNITLYYNNIFYTDGSNKLFCSTLSGQYLWNCDISMVSGIRGITTDDDGNIYVTGYDSNNVVVITSYGKQFRQLLSEADSLKFPTGICYNSKLKSLMVCNEDGPAFLYKIKK